MDLTRPMGPEAAATTAPAAGRTGLWVGVSGLYLALYLHYGFIALLQPWLKANGSSPEEIALLTAIPLILRLLTVASFSAWAGRRGKVRDMVALTTAASAAAILFLLGKPEHAGLVVIFVVFSIVWDQIPVLTDAYAVMVVRSKGLDFGWLRVWGSIGVVLSSLIAGWAIDKAGIGSLPVMIAAFLMLPLIVAILLPRDRSLSVPGEEAPDLGGQMLRDWREVLRDRGVLCAMLATSLIMGSHAVLTAFSAIQWQAEGISFTTIGRLQALAVAAEILAFVFGSKLLGTRDPRLMICLSAIAGTMRWTLMATSPGIAVLIVGQLLNGVTATGAILGMMLVIARRVPTHLGAAAQGLNAVLLGVVLAVAMIVSGPLWSQGVAVAYLAMAVLALLGAFVAWPGRAAFSGARA